MMLIHSFIHSFIHVTTTDAQISDMKFLTEDTEKVLSVGLLCISLVL